MSAKISNWLNKPIFFTITLIIGGLLFIVVINSVGIDKIIETVSAFKLWHFALLISLNAAALLISIIRWKIILDATGNIAPFKKVLAARMIGYSVNYLTPSGLVLGEPFKGMVLAGKTGLNLGSTMVSIVIEGSIFLSTLLLFVIIGTFSFLSYSNLSGRMILVTIGAIFILIFVFYLFFTKMIKPTGAAGEMGFFSYLIDILRLNKIPFIGNLKNKIVRRENEIQKFFQLHRRTVFLSIFLSIAEIAMTLASFWLTLYFLNFTISVRVLLGIFSLMSISYLIPLPASLGGLELSQVFAFGFFALGGQATALAFTLIIRVISLIFVAIGIGYLIEFEIDVIYKKTAEFSIKLKQKIRGFFQSL